ncbi:MAG: thioredoxin [Rhabdochlamydiaceae bacterium]
MSSSEVKTVSQEEFKNHIAVGSFLVDFYADWCGPCRMLAPVLSQVAKEMSNELSVVKINVDDAQELSSQLGISSIPTVIFFKNGEERGRFVGVKDVEGIKKFVGSSI